MPGFSPGGELVAILGEGRLHAFPFLRTGLSTSAGSRRMNLNECWTKENRVALEQLLRTDFPYTPIAAFDWDNTCIRGDLGTAVFHHLARDLAFRFEAPGFWDWLQEVLPVDEVSAAYEAFCTRADATSRAKLRFQLERQRQRVHEGEDDTSAWAWYSGVFIGWGEEEARQYSRKAIACELARPREFETVEFQGESIRIARGIRLRPAVKELVELLQKAGWVVWIVSASPQWEVEAFAALYGIPADRVVAMRREVRDGRITRIPIRPVSYGDGKLDAYRTFVDFSQPPTLAAGDSLGDWKLLEWAERTRILVEPAPEKLREFALWRKSEGEEWLLQRFD